MSKDFRQWAKNVKIWNSRAIQAFDEGRIVRFDLLKNGKRQNCLKDWRIKCRAEFCSETYSHLTTTPGAKAGFCRFHWNKDKLLRSLPPELQHHAKYLKWMPRSDGGRRAYRRCQHGTCHRYVIFVRTKKSWFCGFHDQKVRRRMPPYKRQYNQLLSQQKGRKSRLLNGKKIEVRMSYEQFAALCRKANTCFYCGVDVERLAYPTRKQLMDREFRDKEISSLDRLDFNGHYEIGNVVTCCPSCNMSRNRFMSVEEMKILGAIRAGDVKKAMSLAIRHKKALKKWAIFLQQKGIFGVLGFGGKNASRAIKVK